MWLVYLRYEDEKSGRLDVRTYHLMASNKKEVLKILESAPKRAPSPTAKFTEYEAFYSSRTIKRKMGGSVLPPLMQDDSKSRAE